MDQKSQSKTAGVIALPPVIYLTALLAGAAIQIALPQGFLPSWEFQLVGVVFFGLGFFLAATARRAMVAAGTKINPFEPSTALVQEGPYRFTRNPMYLGLTLGYLGLAILLNALWILILLPLVLIVMQFGVILREERYLESLFGSKYLQYKSQVRRWM